MTVDEPLTGCSVAFREGHDEGQHLAELLTADDLFERAFVYYQDAAAHLAERAEFHIGMAEAFAAARKQRRRT